MTDLHRRIYNFLALILAQVELLRPDLPCPLCQFRHRREIEIRAQVPEQRTRDSDERPIRELCLAPLDGLDRLFIDSHLVVPGLDKPAGNVFDLLASLDEKIVALGHLDRNAVAGIASPNVQTRVAGTPVDGEKVEVRVEASEDGVLFAVLNKIGCSRSEKVRTMDVSSQLRDQMRHRA